MSSNIETIEENSLTSPEDRDRSKKWRPNQGAPKLTELEVETAMLTLNDNVLISRFPRVERAYADPEVPRQHIGLISFVPAKDATPNKNGIYGFVKLRGNFNTEIEADERAEFLIRNVDSFHRIQHAPIGYPVPLTERSDFAKEVKEIDLQRDTATAMSESVKKEKLKDKQEIETMKQRQEALLAESKQEEVDPYDEYITQSIKKAQLTWTYLQHHEKILEICDIIKKTKKIIADLDKKHPEFRNNFFDKYMQARRDAGFRETSESAAQNQDNFIKYLVEDKQLPGIDFPFTMDPNNNGDNGGGDNGSGDSLDNVD